MFYPPALNQPESISYPVIDKPGAEFDVLSILKFEYLV